VRINVGHANMTMASEARQIEICGHSIRVVMRGAGCGGTPLLLFNGIGGNIELLQPFIEALGEIEAVVFDIPGVGASSEPLLPYRLRTMAHLADRLMTKLGYEEEFDVFGVSWGGALAQQFAFQYGRRCRRLVLAATSQGVLMVPGRLRSLLKMASPRRFAFLPPMSVGYDRPGPAATYIRSWRHGAGLAFGGCLGCANPPSYSRAQTIRSCLWSTRGLWPR